MGRFESPSRSDTQQRLAIASVPIGGEIPGSLYDKCKRRTDLGPSHNIAAVYGSTLPRRFLQRASWQDSFVTIACYRRWRDSDVLIGDSRPPFSPSEPRPPPTSTTRKAMWNETCTQPSLLFFPHLCASARLPLLGGFSSFPLF